MTEVFLTREQVEDLTYDQCQRALKRLNRAYNLNGAITRDNWPILDDIINTLLYLEDRIKRYEDPRIPSMDPESQIAVKSPDTAERRPTGPRRRRFRVDDKVYESVNVASEQLGLAIHTLRCYVNRDPKKYGYLD
jgi:hypothetical protein